MARRKPYSVYERDGEWYCRVNGQEFGPWAVRQYAEGGAQVELRRAEERAARRETCGVV